ncbi:hypothetical protein [Bacillus thuringiensis]|uniref:hypothetical protein n=1 Tax=Bacillus thuringiensis TaxID=1428 RepID=UPI000BFE86F5|nr:hypothetical protein [Bacillus thuringiensis]PGM50835.1 hypothetical protein CN949_16220 [Bacillus thuringiensis]
MIVAHLIGGNAVKGIRDGVVFINGKQLETSYQDLVAVCGNISLGDLDTSVGTWRHPKDVRNDYIKLVQEFDEDIDESFVIDNHLTAEICYSEYEIDIETKTLILKIDIYN